MFEINLVPDVKAQLLKKLRMRNLVIFISIVVAVGAAGVVALLGSVVTGQNIAMSNQDEEIRCRSVGPQKADGSDKCDNKYGTAVLQIANINEFLTIQDQMNKLATINEQKMLLSRVFGILDVILPTGDDVVEVSELTVDMANASLNFDAQGNSVSQIDYRALEVFKNTVKLAYYDYGRYMRFDEESNDFVEIPTTCIDESLEDGILYGIYHKGAPGCEASLLSSEQQAALQGTDEDEAENDETEDTEVTDIKIVRDYKTSTAKEEYMDFENEVDGNKYYFDSMCVVYKEDGKFDEESTRTTCQLSEEDPSIRDSSNGRDSNGSLVLRFTSTVTLNREVFYAVNRHMRVIGPTRQNVTDSYTQIRDMFTERAKNCAPEDPDYAQCMEDTSNG